jgi:hypothetical protein
VHSIGKEKWASISSGAFGRLYHILLSGLWTISAYSVYVMDDIVWHGRYNDFRQLITVNDERKNVCLCFLNRAS